MGKKTQQSDRMGYSIVFSMVLHILLISLLLFGSLTQKVTTGGGGAEGDIIDAVMVDPKVLVQQYQRQQQQKIDMQRAQEQRQKKALRQAEELQQKYIAGQQRLKDLEKERLQVQQAADEVKQQTVDQQKRIVEQQKQAQALTAKAKEEQKQAEAAAENAKKKQREAEEKQMQAEAKQIKTEEEAQKKAAIAAKKKADMAKKTAIQAAKESSDVDDLFDSLASSQPVSQSNAATAGKGGGKKSGASTTEINSYLAQIKMAIEAKFHDAKLFKGQICKLRIKLAPDGMLIDIIAEGGDPALCKAALMAAKQARIPKPPSDELYDIFKNIPLVFKPE